MNVFVFDIETIPDLDGGRRLLGLDGLDDAGVANAMAAKRRAETGGSDFPRLHLHRVAVISVVYRGGDQVKVWSLGDERLDEAGTLQRFFDGIERYSPTLVSWNGSGFDLPVLHYRAMIHGIEAPRYWETGHSEQSFRWNNYLNRYHDRHTDVMDLLAGHQPRAYCGLDDLALLCGFPGKLGMSGEGVAAAIDAGRFGEVRDYCETDVLNTYLLYLRLQLLRGHLRREDHRRECALLRAALAHSGKAHLQAFLAAWPEHALELPSSANGGGHREG